MKETSCSSAIKLNRNIDDLSFGSHPSMQNALKSYWKQISLIFLTSSSYTYKVHKWFKGAKVLNKELGSSIYLLRQYTKHHTTKGNS